MAADAPMPRPSVRMATAEKPGARTRPRNPCRNSRQNIFLPLLRSRPIVLCGYARCPPRVRLLAHCAEDRQRAVAEGVARGDSGGAFILHFDGAMRRSRVVLALLLATGAGFTRLAFAGDDPEDASRRLAAVES